MVNFKDLGLRINVNFNKVTLNDGTEVEVRDYLPTPVKTQLIQYVVNGALDDNTGCFSPLRVEVYFNLGICIYYTNLELGITDGEDLVLTYDILESNGIIDAIRSVIPSKELQYMEDLIKDTVQDISRYNSSAAGIIQSMGVSAENLDSQLVDILNKVKDGEEDLKTIKDVVGVV